MRRIAIVTAAILMLAFAAAAADVPGPGWWRRPEVAERLALTDEQRSKLDAIFRGAANELIDARGEVEKQNVALRGELDQSQLSRERIQKAATKLSDARTRLFERELMMLVDMRAVLSESQWSRLRTTLEKEEQRPRGGNMPPRRRPPPNR